MLKNNNNNNKKSNKLRTLKIVYYYCIFLNRKIDVHHLKIMRETRLCSLNSKYISLNVFTI